MYQYRYALLDDIEKFKEIYSFESFRDESDTQNLALVATHDHYSRDKDLWGYGPPISLELFKEDGESLGIFLIGYNQIPDFWVISERKYRHKKRYCI